MIRLAAVTAPIHVDGSGRARLLWARRTDGAPALAGFHVCPGGLIDALDRDAPHGGGSEAAARVCALRELFEEVGLLLAEGGDALDVPARSELRAAFAESAALGNERFRALNLRWKTEILEPIGRWVTPSHAPRRFDTHFFGVVMERAETPDPDAKELSEAVWVEARDALGAWARGEVLMTPPTASLLRSLERHGRLVPDELRSLFGATCEESYRWEIVPHVQMLALRTPTLPPATHTNSYLLGSGEALLVEPATPHEGEQDRMVTWVREARADGIVPKAIFATHHHPDHVGGARALSEKLGLPLWGHAATAERLAGQLRFERLIEDGESITLDGPTPLTLEAVHTPGHAPGHLCLLDRASGALIAGDMVASVGTILVEPTDGDMAQYLDSLRRMLALGPSVLLPAHGMPIRAVRKVLEHYIAHRLAREARVLAALRSIDRPASAEDLLPSAYADAPKGVWPLAALSTEAHLIKLMRDGRARRTSAGWIAI